MNKIPNADYLDADWQSEITSKNLLKKGYSSITFKNINDTSVESPIESGSVIEINGVFYEFDADTTPSGTLQDGINYVRVIGGSSPDVEYTTDPLPKYDEKRKGYYDASDRRYIMKIDKSESFDTIYYNNVKELAYGDDMVIGRITESGAPTFPYKIIKSTDGITWTTTFSSDGSHSVLGLYHDGSKFCMFYDYEMHTSLDGETWNPQGGDVNEMDGEIIEAIGDGTNHVVIQNYDTGFARGGIIKHSDDNGSTWTKVYDGADGTWLSSVGYGDGLFFTTLEESGTWYPFTSSDGITWTKGTSFGSAPDKCNTSSKYINGKYYICLHTELFESTDGSSWTSTSYDFAMTDFTYDGSIWWFVNEAYDVVSTSTGEFKSIPNVFHIYYFNNKLYVLGDYLNYLGLMTKVDLVGDKTLFNTDIYTKGNKLYHGYELQFSNFLKNFMDVVDGSHHPQHMIATRRAVVFNDKGSPTNTYSSVDGGESWSSVGGDSIDTGTAPFAIYEPTNGNPLIVRIDHGNAKVYYDADMDAWSELRAHPPASLGKAIWADGGDMVASADDEIYKFRPDADTWEQVLARDTYDASVLQSGGGVLYAWHSSYGEYDKSLDKGDNWMAFDPLNFPDNFMYRNGLYIGRKGAKIVTSTDGENYTVRYETSSDINVITYIEKVLGIEGFGFYFATSADSFLFSDDGIHWIDIPVNIEILNLVQVPSGLIISNHTDGKTYKLRM